MRGLCFPLAPVFLQLVLASASALVATILGSPGGHALLPMPRYRSHGAPVGVPGPFAFLAAASHGFNANACASLARLPTRVAAARCLHMPIVRPPHQQERHLTSLKATRTLRDTKEQEIRVVRKQTPSIAFRTLATGCYVMPLIDTLQAFAPVPALGQLAGRLGWCCNMASMGASFLVLRKKLLPAPPFVKHHLMTASLLSMCCFTMANIHYKVLSFFIAGRGSLQESLAFAAGASLFSLICPAALSAAKGRAASLPVLSEAVALHLGPDNFPPNAQGQKEISPDFESPYP